MVDIAKEGDGDDTTKDNPLDKPPKRRHRRCSKFRHSKNSDNSARNNNTPVDSKGNDDPMDPTMKQGELGDGENSPEPTSDNTDPEGKIQQPVPREEDSPDDDALIIPEKLLEQENLHRRLIATVRSLKKLNRRWSEVLGTEEKYDDDRHAKSYPKRKLLPEFDDEAIEPIHPKNDRSIGPTAPWP